MEVNKDQSESEIYSWKLEAAQLKTFLLLLDSFLTSSLLKSESVSCFLTSE